MAIPSRMFEQIHLCKSRLRLGPPKAAYKFMKSAYRSRGENLNDERHEAVDNGADVDLVSQDSTTFENERFWNIRTQQSHELDAPKTATSIKQ